MSIDRHAHPRLQLLPTADTTLNQQRQDRFGSIPLFSYTSPPHGTLSATYGVPIKALFGEPLIAAAAISNTGNRRVVSMIIHLKDATIWHPEGVVQLGVGRQSESVTIRSFADNAILFFGRERIRFGLRITPAAFYPQ